MQCGAAATGCCSPTPTRYSLTSQQHSGASIRHSSRHVLHLTEKTDRCALDSRTSTRQRRRERPPHNNDARTAQSQWRLVSQPAGQRRGEAEHSRRSAGWCAAERRESNMEAAAESASHRWAAVGEECRCGRARVIQHAIHALESEKSARKEETKRNGSWVEPPRRLGLDHGSVMQCLVLHLVATRTRRRVTRHFLAFAREESIGSRSGYGSVSRSGGSGSGSRGGRRGRCRRMHIDRELEVEIARVSVYVFEALHHQLELSTQLFCGRPLAELDGLGASGGNVLAQSSNCLTLHMTVAQRDHVLIHFATTFTPEETRTNENAVHGIVFPLRTEKQRTSEKHVRTARSITALLSHLSRRPSVKELRVSASLTFNGESGNRCSKHDRAEMMVTESSSGQTRGRNR